MCRLDLLNTSSLPEKNPKAPDYMYEHSFEILLWIVTQLAQFDRYIHPEERFFEKPADKFVRPEVGVILSNLLILKQKELISIVSTFQVF